MPDLVGMLSLGVGSLWLLNTCVMCIVNHIRELPMASHIAPMNKENRQEHWIWYLVSLIIWNFAMLLSTYCIFQIGCLDIIVH